MRSSTVMGNALRTALTVGGAGQPLDLQLHEALGGEADHLAQEIGIGTLFQKGTKSHHFVGRRWILGSVVGSATKPYRWFAMTTASRVTPPTGTRPEGVMHLRHRYS